MLWNPSLDYCCYDGQTVLRAFDSFPSFVCKFLSLLPFETIPASPDCTCSPRTLRARIWIFGHSNNSNIIPTTTHVSYLFNLFFKRRLIMVFPRMYRTTCITRHRCPRRVLDERLGNVRVPLQCGRPDRLESAFRFAVSQYMMDGDK